MNNPRQSKFNPHDHKSQLIKLLKAIEAHQGILNVDDLNSLQKKYPKNNRGLFKKSEIIAGFRTFAGNFGLKPINPNIIGQIRMKPVRTISGVTPVTVLTKPYPCPGKCIFCPNDVRMPKSYISSEPGAQRAEKNLFDPYLQAFNRLQTYQDIGHPQDKVELIILGGTWSFYPKDYRIWFINRLFEALNDFGNSLDNRKGINPSLDTSKIDSSSRLISSGIAQSYNQSVSTIYANQEANKLSTNKESCSWKTLEREQEKNETAKVRCVGLVLETRPDYVDEKEVIFLRRLGCTKVQIGLQSLNDQVLKQNKRGHTVSQSAKAINMLRQAGFKIHTHWMPNLFGSSVHLDMKDYLKLFTDNRFKPDELKIYPCSLITDTELMDIYSKGDWQPYTHEELLSVVAYCLTLTPEYCRLTRVVRDIPSNEIIDGNKMTNFRQIAEIHVNQLGGNLSDIRSREIKDSIVKASDLKLKQFCYQTSTSIEYFLQYINQENKIAGYLRLSLPKSGNHTNFIEELENVAIIREVHVYGQAIIIGKKQKGASQHIGLGKKLISKAKDIAKSSGFSTISVISAVGTKEYYRKLKFTDGQLYQHAAL